MTAEEIVRKADVLSDAIIFFGKKTQTIVAIEELSELIKELTKTLRGEMNIDHLTEEIADVEIMLLQIKAMYDISFSDLDKHTAQKVERLKERIRGARQGNG